MISGLVHSIVGTAANVADVTQVGKLPHVAESVVSADVGYTGMKKRSEHEERKVIWQIAARRSSYQKCDKDTALLQIDPQDQEGQGSNPCQGRTPVLLIKRQFGYTKVRFHGLVKNTAQLMTLFALSNLWIARRHLLAATGKVRL